MDHVIPEPSAFNIEGRWWSNDGVLDCRISEEWRMDRRCTARRCRLSTTSRWRSCSSARSLRSSASYLRSSVRLSPSSFTCAAFRTALARCANFNVLTVSACADAQLASRFHGGDDFLWCLLLTNTILSTSIHVIQMHALPSPAVTVHAARLYIAMYSRHSVLECHVWSIAHENGV